MTETQREKRREYMRAYRQRPEQKAKEAAYRKEHSRRPEVKARLSEYWKNRYRTDEAFRQKAKESVTKHAKKKRKEARIAKAIALLQGNGYIFDGQNVTTPERSDEQ